MLVSCKQAGGCTGSGLVQLLCFIVAFSISRWARACCIPGSGHGNVSQHVHVHAHSRANFTHQPELTHGGGQHPATGGNGALQTTATQLTATAAAGGKEHQLPTEGAIPRSLEKHLAARQPLHVRPAALTLPTAVPARMSRPASRRHRGWSQLPSWTARSLRW